MADTACQFRRAAFFQLGEAAEENEMPRSSPKYYGKFRGTVTNNIDPMQIGRLQVMVPDVSGLAPMAWAMPCVPVAGVQSGVLVMPMIGANIWVEFERGDPDYPVWVGGFWGNATDVPKGGPNPVPGVTRLVMQTALKHCIAISDADDGIGGIVLQSADGASVRINRTGITIQNGQGASIRLAGPTVDINNGALAVT